MAMFEGSGRQIYATLCSNLLSCAYGTSIGWASSSLPFLQSNETVLPTGPLSKEASSWIQSIFTIGGLLGGPLFGWLSDRVGRKKSLIFVAVPQIISWLLIVFAQNWFYIFASRFLGGLSGGGLYIIIPLFVSEIADDNIRGRLGSVFVLASGSGVLFAYTCGTFFSYSTLPYIFIPLSLLFLIGTMFHPESAHYLIKNDRNDEALVSIKFYRETKSNASSKFQTPSEQSKIEFEGIKNLIGERQNGQANFEWNDFSSKPAKKVLLIGIGLMFLEQFSGVFSLLFFVSTIFEYSGSSFTPNQSSIIVGVIQLIGAYCSTMLVDRIGRRPLISISAFGISSGMFIFALHSHLNILGYTSSQLNWIPLASFSFVLWIANLGVLTLPFLVMSELMTTLPKIKSYVYIFCLSLSWIFAFVIVKYLESLIGLLSISGLMFIFSINSLLGGLFVVWYIPETKERSFQEILNSLEK